MPGLPGGIVVGSPPAAAGVTDHGALTGLADDDHPQYLTQAEGDARYWALATDLATQAELNTHEADTTAVHGLAETRDAALEVGIDGGGAVITTGVKGDVEVPFACTITAVRLLADQSGSIVVDIWKDTYANFPPVVGDSITAAAKPTLSGAAKSQDSTLTGWTTSLAKGDILRFNVDSVATVTRVTLSLTLRRS